MSYNCPSLLAWELLGTALPGFRGCNPPWLRLTQNWDHKPLRRQSLSPWQGCHLCPLHPAWPWACPVSQWWERILKGGSTQDRLWSPGISSQERTQGAVAKGCDGPSPLVFKIARVLILSARSLLISWLLYFPCLISAWSTNRGQCSPVLTGADSLGTQA